MSKGMMEIVAAQGGKPVRGTLTTMNAIAVFWLASNGTVAFHDRSGSAVRDGTGSGRRARVHRR